MHAGCHDIAYLSNQFGPLMHPEGSLICLYGKMLRVSCIVAMLDLTCCIARQSFGHGESLQGEMSTDLALENCIDFLLALYHFRVDVT